jgi:hypothetical protein
MKSTANALFLLVLFSACHHKVDQADIARINGYWEIKKVVMPNGKEKEYGINTSYDFFDIKANKGLRKKVMPQLDGSFLENNSSEAISVSFDKNGAWLNYSTPFSKWREELYELSDSAMVVINEQKKEYHYKKAGAINIMGHGEKTK